MSNKCPYHADEYDETLYDPDFMYHPAHDWVMEMTNDIPWPMVNGFTGETYLMLEKRYKCAKCGATIIYRSEVDEETGTTLFSPRCKKQLIKAFE